MSAEAPSKLIIITAPSGSGKSTIVKYLMQEIPSLRFSVSACTRPPRNGEKDGIDYHFMSLNEFEQKITEDAFAEYEMVYQGKYYGTLKSELIHITQQGQVPLVDIDVQGALRLKSYYQHRALCLFIQAPSIAELENRLRARGTETPESLAERITKAEQELSYASSFDTIIVNDILTLACEQAKQHIEQFIQLP